MRKRKILWILYVILVLLLIGIAVCMLVMQNHEERRDTAEELEKLRDQLKVYVPVETEKPPDVETVPESIAETEVSPKSVETEETETVVSETFTETEASSELSTEADTAPTDITNEKTTETAEAKPVLSANEMTIDFQPLWEVNPDVHAWIEIEGTKVDYPILQSAKDDSKYLTTALNGSYYIGGSLFTQRTYNNRDFDDPVTVIYGHTMRSGTLFGQLQEIYTSKSSFDQCSEIKLYLPGEVREYTVFAAVPYSNIHILAAYDFSKEYWFNNFFDGVSDIREFGAQFNRDITPEYGDRVIILSTCLNEDSTRRFLVMAIYQDDIE